MKNYKPSNNIHFLTFKIPKEVLFSIRVHVTQDFFPPLECSYNLHFGSMVKT